MQHVRRAACAPFSMFMRKIAFTATMTLAALSLCCSCGSKTDHAASAADTTASSQSNVPYAEAALTNTYTATLAGKHFEITVKREADQQLPVVTDEVGKQYYDNRVQVDITADGKPFYSHAFTREAFAGFATEQETVGCVLLGMAFDSERSDAHALRLGAQIGQVGIEEGPAFIVEIPLDGGAASIVRDKQQDTTGDDGMSE